MRVVPLQVLCALALVDLQRWVMFEGVTVTKGFDAFWRTFRIGDSNRTLFHLHDRGHRR